VQHSTSSLNEYNMKKKRWWWWWWRNYRSHFLLWCMLIIIISSFFSLAVDFFSHKRVNFRTKERTSERVRDCSFIFFSLSLRLAFLSFHHYMSKERKRERERRDLHFLSCISKRSVNTFLILLNRITNCT
jgi:hypothetical protein